MAYFSVIARGGYKWVEMGIFGAFFGYFSIFLAKIKAL